ncbi:3-hexulose-6-phosphate synthase [Raineyella sp. W15-4]|uniref:3-hexulose-6-phosphate synthase n=1 Tax=Raineyella sp. W15-4 TaxID=3081651 RepID=UPI0029554FB6|nr:3-hexulose-6-phosphate synthase [Raineyella sp. W15-4]WOQ18582.1 3-hexulose-6-phosphate synthase [Raineyella sp. W15-4]
MKLQLAYDVSSLPKAVAIAAALHDVIDVFEVGTPLIIKEGTAPIRALKEAFPDLCVLADAKIVDGGEGECRDICEAGADIITVLAYAADETIAEVVRVAHEHGRTVMADLIGVRDIAGRAAQLLALDVDLIGVHTAYDVQKLGRTPLRDLTDLVAAVPAERATVAGGVKLETVKDYAALHPGTIIAGSALYNADDPRAAALAMKQEIERHA